MEIQLPRLGALLIKVEIHIPSDRESELRFRLGCPRRPGTKGLQREDFGRTGRLRGRLRGRGRQQFADLGLQGSDSQR